MSISPALTSPCVCISSFSCIVVEVHIRWEGTYIIVVGTTHIFDQCSLDIGSFWQWYNIKVDITSKKKRIIIQTLSSTLLSGKLLLSVLKLISSVPLIVDFVQTEPPLEFSRKHCVGRESHFLECVLAHVIGKMNFSLFLLFSLILPSPTLGAFLKARHKFERLGQVYHFFYYLIHEIQLAF